MQSLYSHMSNVFEYPVSQIFTRENLNDRFEVFYKMWKHLEIYLSYYLLNRAAIKETNIGMITRAFDLFLKRMP